MCGIAGILGFNDEALLRAMTRIISYRGPDDEGVYADSGAGLGHRRLSIIDLSTQGHQPMTDTDRRAVIVYNGEIYNFQETKDLLEKKGYKFASRTDTELVLNAYLEWGESSLERLNGMFAFSIWDKKKRSMFIARDRIGIKPLYYAIRGNALAFSSEIKSILLWEKIDRKVNTRALDYYFTFRYNQLDETMFEGIRKLPPGCFIKAHLDDSGVLHHEIKRYWDIDLTAPSINAGEHEISNELSARLRKSVDLQMLSDVPLGTFLSSGVDSSTITAIMKRELEKHTSTFTVGFGYEGFEDELNPVRYTVKRLGTDHTEYICTPDMASLLPRIVWHTDELNADPALIPTYLISEIARRKVKVILSGEGGDELFGGYERTMFIKYAWLMNRIAPPLVRSVPFLVGMVPMGLLDKVFKYSSMIGTKGLKRLGSFCRNIGDLGSAYLDVSCVFTQEEKHGLYGQGMARQLADENIGVTLNKRFFPHKPADTEELIRRLSYLELATRLPNDLLNKADTMSMAHSLEARVPYLDHTLVEFAFTVPARLKIKGMKEKYILRETALKFLPPEIVKRKKDHFFVPIHLWMQNELRELVEQVLSPQNVHKTGLLNPSFVSKAYANYQKGALFYARQLWNVLNFLIWHRMYIETDRFRTMGENPATLKELFEA